MEEYEVIHRPERNRFELEKNGMTAFVEYEAILPNAEKVETVKRMGNSQLPPRDFMTEW